MNVKIENSQITETSGGAYVYGVDYKEFADLLARQLGSPKAIDRMTSYLYQARPASVEMIVDEMLSICAEIDAWREKKESREAQAGYSMWLASEERLQKQEEGENP